MPWFLKKEKLRILLFSFLKPSLYALKETSIGYYRKQLLSFLLYARILAAHTTPNSLVLLRKIGDTSSYAQKKIKAY